MNGQITYYNSQKGYGFIRANNEDYFFHITDIENSEIPEKFKNVSFTATNNERGNAAINIIIKKNDRNKFITFGETRIKASNIKNYGLKYIRTTYDIYQKIWIAKLIKKRKLLSDLYEYIDTGEWKKVPSKQSPYRNEMIKEHINSARTIEVRSYEPRPINYWYPDDRPTDYWYYDRLIFSGKYNPDGEMIVEEKQFFLSDIFRDANEKCSHDFKSENPRKFHSLYITTFQNDNFTFDEESVSFDIYDKMKELDDIFTE